MLRKSLIYKTGVEYGDYTLNHVLGCSHGCLYPCYAYMMAKRYGKVANYEEWITPNVAENTLEILEKELPRFRDKIQLLHLCFTTDPFMYGHDEIGNLSMEVLRRANEAGVRCSVLTKGILPVELANLPLDNEYGITLISLDEDFTRQYEPGAANPVERLNALRTLHERGRKTWISIEPYPTPNILEQDLALLLQAVSFVDRIIFGRLHYNRIVAEYPGYKDFYNQCALEVIEFCEDNDIDYHIKKGTQSRQGVR